MDNVWSWVVLIVCLLTYGTTFGMPWSMGIYMVPLLEEFESDKRPTAFALSIGYSIYCFAAPIGSVLYKLFDCRRVIMSSALIAASGYLLSYFTASAMQLTFAQILVGGRGIGYGLTGPPLLAVQAEYFIKYRSLATSLVTVGCPVGLFMFPQMFTWLIDVYGWRGSMLINAGLALQLVVAGAVIRPTKQTPNQQQSGNGKLFETWIFKNPNCWLIWCIVGGFKGLGVLYFTFINAYLLGNGIEKHVAAFMISISGCTNLVGRLSGLFLVHKTSIGVRRAVVVCILAVMVLQPIVTGIGDCAAVFGVAVGLVGLCDGALVVVLVSIMIEQFGPDAFAFVFGFNSVGAAISTIVWSQIGGKFGDVFGITCVIYLSSCPGLLAFVGAVGFFVLGFWNRLE